MLVKHFYLHIRKSLKIKLGSPEGLEADKAMFNQVVESTRSYDVKLRVDANGGWDVSEAQYMMQWLADRKVDYIEQPLKEGEEDNLKKKQCKAIKKSFL